ncbi:MAG: hypothetical protein U0T81_18305 [Saprospiraceae bacterium]
MAQEYFLEAVQIAPLKPRINSSLEMSGTGTLEVRLLPMHWLLGVCNQILTQEIIFWFQQATMVIDLTFAIGLAYIGTSGNYLNLTSDNNDLFVSEPALELVLPVR